MISARLRGDNDRERILSEDQAARRGGVQGVPFFIFEQKYALSGAQSEAAFLNAFDKLAEQGMLT